MDIITHMSSPAANVSSGHIFDYILHWYADLHHSGRVQTAQSEALRLRFRLHQIVNVWAFFLIFIIGLNHTPLSSVLNLSFTILCLLSVSAHANFSGSSVLFVATVSACWFIKLLESLFRATVVPQSLIRDTRFATSSDLGVCARLSDLDRLPLIYPLIRLHCEGYFFLDITHYIHTRELWPLRKTAQHPSTFLEAPFRDWSLAPSAKESLLVHCSHV